MIRKNNALRTHRATFLLTLSSIIGVCILIGVVVTFLIPHRARQCTYRCVSSNVNSNVVVDLQSVLHSSAPDSQLGITAVMKNNNEGPVRDGVLYVRVYKDASPNDPERFVDSFVAVRGVDIAAGGTSERTFTWRVPVDAVQAKYHLRGSLVYPDRPFISTPVAIENGAMSLPIVSNVQGSVYIDPQNIVVNGVRRTDSVSASTFVSKQDVTVEIQVINTSSVPYDGTLTWRLYKDKESPLSETPLKASTSDVRIHPHSSATVTYTIPRPDQQTYALDAQLVRGMTSQSVIGLSLVNEALCTKECF